MRDEVRRFTLSREMNAKGLVYLIRGHGPMVVEYDVLTDRFNCIPLDDMPARSAQNVAAIREALRAVFDGEDCDA